MILSILVVLFLLLAAVACLALVGAVTYLVLVVAPAALEVDAIKTAGVPKKGEMSKKGREHEANT